MNDYIIISWLNDFIFCPVSIYFHQLYGNKEKILCQSTAQIAGTNAHGAVDEGKYSTRKTIMQGTSVISEKYRLVGKKTTDGKIKHQSTCYRLFLLFVIGHITITSGILQRASRFGFGVVLMSNGLKVYDFIGSKMEGNVLLRKHQYDYKGLDLAKHILENKVHNQRILLEEERHKNAELKQAIEKLKAYEKRISAYDGKDLSELLGLEGLAARLYCGFNEVLT